MGVCKEGGTCTEEQQLHYVSYFKRAHWMTQLMKELCTLVYNLEVEVIIYALPPSSPAQEQLDLLVSTLSSFSAANDNPATSPHLKATTPDKIDGLVQLLARPEIHKDAERCALVLKALKILSRRQDNRQRCGGHTFQTLMPFCSVKLLPAIASEAANAALNLAYEPQNVAHLVRCKGELALLQLLASGQEEVLANAAGAVQTVCYQKEGREAVKRGGGVAVLLKLLQREELDAKVQQRAVGALHNLSSEADAIKLVRLPMTEVWRKKPAIVPVE
ncbi:hypothetical protein N2152v2_004636 [Parachlorella kessleri]